MISNKKQHQQRAQRKQKNSLHSFVVRCGGSATISDSVANDFLINNKNDRATNTESILVAFCFHIDRWWLEMGQNSRPKTIAIGTAGSKKFHPINCFIYDRFDHWLSSRARTHKPPNKLNDSSIHFIDWILLSGDFGILGETQNRRSVSLTR